jgi:hypothetical protein
MGHARSPRPAPRASTTRSPAAPTQAATPSPPLLARLPRFSLATLPITAQRATGGTRPAPARPLQQPSARAGLPGRLKAGIETLSGVSMDEVRVHYNSPHPARLDALAYARGREIHLAPGQEAQLPHEAWHIVQQAQGRVKPTLQMAGGTPVNDDRGLESEADRMGQRAAAGPAQAAAAPPAAALPAGNAPVAPVQRARSWWKKKNAYSKAAMIGGGLGLALGGLMASPVVAGLGAAALIGGGIARYMSRPAPSTAPVTDEDWFGHKREKTAYGYTNPKNQKGLQGPHFLPHIGKEMMSERSIQRNPNFDPSMIYEGSSVIPTPGQARKLLSHHEQASGTKIPMHKKKELDQDYKELLRQKREASTKKERIHASVQAMERNPMTTYAHGSIATRPEIKYKGENRKTVGPDLDKMEQMQKGQPDPTFAKIDHGRGDFKAKHLSQYLRQHGQISRGDPNLSDLDTDSEDEYP